MQETEAKDLVAFIVKSLVDHPEDVDVEAIEERGILVLELRVASADMGRVIGKGGRVINAVRAIVQVQAAKLGRRVALEIMED